MNQEPKEGTFFSFFWSSVFLMRFLRGSATVLSSTLAVAGINASSRYDRSTDIHRETNSNESEFLHAQRCARG